MLTEMRGAGLPARVVYAAIALPAGGVAGFYACVRLLPKLASMLGLSAPEADTEALFRLALSVGAGAALTAFLCALTLPWKRRRQRQGRGIRISVTCVLVVAASLAFAGLGHRLIYDLLFAAWLAYLFALTYVRYGVVDYRTFDRS